MFWISKILSCLSCLSCYLCGLYILFFSTLISGNEKEEPIFVRLATETELIPVYFTHVESKDSMFTSAYCSELEKVLRFDLDHNAMTHVLPSTKDREKLAKASSFDQAPSPSEWKALGAFYVIKLRIADEKAAVRLFSQNADTIKSIEGVVLEGDLATDRRQVHQLADTIHKTLFGTDGIASTKILYTKKNQKDQTSEVWEADYDGHNPRQVTNDSGYSITPVYMPPKQGFHSGAFFFVSYKTGQPKIYYQGLTDGTQRRLTTLKGNQLMPAISKQRDKIAFISDVTGNPDLFVQAFSPETGAIGKPYQIFSTHQATQGSPAFSPDGSQIAFVSNKDGSARIYAMDVPAPGTSLNDIKAALVTKRNRESTAPSWSPDGTKLAYCCPVNGTRQIWVYDFGTRQERQLTQGTGNKENPTWAPNSKHLIFNSSDKGACELYLINLNQAEATKITSGVGEKRFPSWEPLS